MASHRIRTRVALIAPMVLLVVVVVEEIALYKLRQHVRSPHLRAAAALVFFGVGFAIATSKLAPWLGRILSRARASSRREAGAIGLWLFYAAAYGALYLAYLVLETRGAGGLLPSAWR